MIERPDIPWWGWVVVPFFVAVGMALLWWMCGAPGADGRKWK
jgi:hypothetical protein